MKTWLRIGVLSSFLTLNFGFTQDEGISSKRFQHLSGVRKTNDKKSQWDKKYAAKQYVFGKTPAGFLAKNYHYIPTGGKVLDVGMGEGRNAVFLARKGFKVTGVDISSVAVRKARLLAKEFGVRFEAVVSSMRNFKAEPKTYDAIIVFYFVDKSLHQKLLRWLKPGGVLIYEAHTVNQLKVKGFEHYNRSYILKKGELLHMFPGLKVLKYEEPLHLDEYTTSIIVKKPEVKEVSTQ